MIYYWIKRQAMEHYARDHLIFQEKEENIETHIGRE